MNVTLSGSKHRALWRRARLGLGALSCLAVLGAACSEGEDGEACIGGGGAVAAAEDQHCLGPDGMPTVQAIGACVTSAPAGAGEGEEEHEHEEEEAAPIRTGREAIDDDCKYRVRFENTCAAVAEPVTFTLSLTRLFDGQPGAGTVPENLEVFMAEDLGHISPSNDITARETSPGTYEIGPVIFDEPGRWVVRFHYFETCSDITPDSPHGHVAFYFDVP